MGLKDLFGNLFNKKSEAVRFNCPYKMEEADWMLRVERFNDCLSNKLPWTLANFSARNWPQTWRGGHVGSLIRKHKDVRNMLARIRKAIIKKAKTHEIHNVEVELAGVKHRVGNLLFFYIEIAGAELLLGNTHMLLPLANMACGSLPDDFSGAKTKLRESVRLAYNTTRDVLKPLINVPRCLDHPDSKKARMLQRFVEKHKDEFEFDHVTGYYRIVKKAE